MEIPLLPVREQTRTTYTAFWPLLIFFAALMSWTIYQVVDTIFLEQAQRESIQKLTVQCKDAVLAREKFVELVKDLNEAAATDAGAAQVVNELKIKLNSEGDSADK